MFLYKFNIGNYNQRSHSVTTKITFKWFVLNKVYSFGYFTHNSTKTLMHMIYVTNYNIK